MSRCCRCHRHRPLQAWVTPGGLVLGMACVPCIARMDAYQHRAEAVLKDQPVRKAAAPRKRVRARRHPTDKRIAAALLEMPGLLELRTRRLQADIQARFNVAPCTARNAVAIARRYA